MRDHTEIERRMRFLVTSLKGVLSDKETNEVLHFIDHGEYGVALENLKFICDNKPKPLNAEIMNEMFALANLMEIKLN